MTNKLVGKISPTKWKPIQPKIESFTGLFREVAWNIYQWYMFKKYRDWSCIYQDTNEQWRKRSFSSKYELYWKSIETEAVVTKTEINDEGNVHFLQNTSCVEKVSRLKLYLPRQGWTMKETFIFFKIQAVLKKYRDWSFIYQDKDKQWNWRLLFILLTNKWSLPTRMGL